MKYISARTLLYAFISALIFNVAHLEGTSCRRDESRLGQNRKCRKQCWKDTDCKGENKKCLCDGWCGMSCFNPDAECERLPNPDNGYIEYSGFKYGATLTYNCNRGYIIDGYGTRVCRSDRLWSGSTSKCTPNDDCGVAGDVGNVAHVGRVRGGAYANRGAWPWYVLLLKIDRKDFGKVSYGRVIRGGGSIINDRWILTTALNFLFVETEEIMAVLGATKLPATGSFFPSHVEIRILAEVIQHPKFDKFSFALDAALIRVGRRLIWRNGAYVDDVASGDVISFSKYIRPVCLSCLASDGTYDKADCERRQKHQLEETRIGKAVGMVTGFGFYDPAISAASNILRHGAVTLLDDSSCRNHVNVLKVRENVDGLRYSDEMLCSKSANESLHTDACTGDAGGPLVTQFATDSSWRYYQIGIISWGWQCGSDIPGYYTKVASIMQWVSEVVNGGSTCPHQKAPEHGNLEGKFPYEAGTILKFSCNAGYLLEGSNTLICTKEGRWSHDAPRCVDIKCSFQPPQNGYVTPMKITYIAGSSVRFFCNPGYKREGDELALCMQDGSWSSPPPLCKG